MHPKELNTLQATSYRNQRKPEKSFRFLKKLSLLLESITQIPNNEQKQKITPVFFGTFTLATRLRPGFTSGFTLVTFTLVTFTLVTFTLVTFALVTFTLVTFTLVTCHHYLAYVDERYSG